MSSKTLAVRGAAWTIIGYGFNQGLRLVSNLILTRLLVPELFGLMALINTFIIGLNLFSDVGIGPSIIQNKRGNEPAFYNTAWTLQAIRGFGLWLCCLAIAWPVAQIYDEPQLRWLIPIVGLSTILAGFNSTAIFSLNRRMALGKLTIFEIAIQVATLAVMVGWAWISPTIWALVAGNLVSGFVKMALSHGLVPQTQNRFAWDQTALEELFTFGRWIFVSTAMLFLATQADRLILGKLFSFELLGIYTIAFMIADVPRQVVAAVSHKVIFPLVSQHAELSRETLRAKILPKRRLLLVGFAFLTTSLACFGDVLILSLYNDQYAQAAWMLPILALGIWPIVLFQLINPSLLAIGKPLYGACGNTLKFIYMVVGVPLAFSFLGVLGAIVAIAFNDLPLYGAVTYGLEKEHLSVLKQDFQVTLLLIGLITLICTGRYFLNLGLPIEEILSG
ncbi:MAG: oligosaccharide flippase family protein [Cyanophyceae cyanobacterium]